MPNPSTSVVHPNRTGEVGGVLAGTKPDTATIVRRTFAKSAGGGDVETVVVVEMNVPFRARVQGRRAIAGNVGAEVTESERWELAFPSGTDVQAITDRVYGNQRTWDVLEAGSESFEPEMRVLAVEVIS